MLDNSVLRGLDTAVLEDNVSVAEAVQLDGVWAPLGHLLQVWSQRVFVASLVMGECVMDLDPLVAGRVGIDAAEFVEDRFRCLCERSSQVRPFYFRREEFQTTCLG